MSEMQYACGIAPLQVLEPNVMVQAEQLIIVQTAHHRCTRYMIFRTSTTPYHGSICAGRPLLREITTAQRNVSNGPRV